MAASLTLSQRVTRTDFGGDSHQVVVTRACTGDELSHEYCCYHPMAGPVRPDKVTNLRVDGDVIKWEWSENAFDLASPGAAFERPLSYERGLAWAGPVVRTAKQSTTVAVPASIRPEATLRLEDVTAKDDDGGYCDRCNWCDHG